MDVCVHHCVCVHVSAVLRWQKRVLDPPELELPAVVSPSRWVEGTELGSSVRAIGALNC